MPYKDTSSLYGFYSRIVADTQPKAHLMMKFHIELCDLCSLFIVKAYDLANCQE